MITPFSGRRAANLAKRFQPVVVQGYAGRRDLITDIYGPDLPKDWHGGATGYYRVAATKEYLALNYHWFHRWDWATGHWLKRKLDSHDYDFEGCLMLVRWPLTQWSIPEWLVTQYHNELKFYHWPYHRKGRLWLHSEPKGHSLTLLPIGPISDDNYLVYGEYNLVNMMSAAFQSDWQWIESVFKPRGVDMPNAVNHWIIRRKRGRCTDGLIWTDPERLLIEAGKCHIL